MHDELKLIIHSGRYRITKFVKNKVQHRDRIQKLEEGRNEVRFKKYRAKNDYKFIENTFRTIQKYDFKSSSLIPRKVTGSHTIFINLKGNMY